MAFSSIRYPGDWLKGEAPEQLLGVKTVGSAITITFSGASIAVYNAVGVSRLGAPYTLVSSYILDGSAPVAAITSTSGTIAHEDKPCYHSPILTEGEHTLVITNANGLAYFQVDHVLFVPSPRTSSSSRTPTSAQFNPNTHRPLKRARTTTIAPSFAPTTSPLSITSSSIPPSSLSSATASSAVSSALSSSNGAATPTTDPSKKPSHTNTGAIAGGVVSVVVLLVAALVLSLYFCRRRMFGSRFSRHRTRVSIEPDMRLPEFSVPVSHTERPSSPFDSLRFKSSTIDHTTSTYSNSPYDTMPSTSSASSMHAPYVPRPLPSPTVTTSFAESESSKEPLPRRPLPAPPSGSSQSLALGPKAVEKGALSLKGEHPRDDLPQEDPPPLYRVCNNDD